MPHVPGHVSSQLLPGGAQLPLNPQLPIGTLPATNQAGIPQPQLPTGTTLQPNALAGAPPTGLLGSEQAINQGLQGALGSLQQGLTQATGNLRDTGNVALTAIRGARTQGLGQLGAGISDLQQSQQLGLDRIGSAVQQGVDPLSGFVDPGQQAQQRLGALLGLGGQEAFDQAVVSDPAQAFAQEQARRNLLAGSSATGGLGGGRVLEELTRQGVGFALQDLANQRAGLSGLAGQGLTAAGQIGNLRGQQAGLESGLISNLSQARGQLRGRGADLISNIGQQISGQQQALGSNLGNLAFNTGTQGANLLSGTGQVLGAGRTRAGELLANQLGGTSSALANLVNQQGSGLADLTGVSGGNLANILSGAGTQTGATLGNLAGLLAGGQNALGGNIAGLLGGGVPGTQQTGGNLGGLGQLASGIGTALPALAALSDVRLKENLEPAGVTAGGHNLYSWDWNEEGRRLTGEASGFGVIAQEVEQKDPDSVVMSGHGYLMVDYSRIH